MKTILQKQILLMNRNEESHFFQQKIQAAKAFVLVGSVLLLNIGTGFAQDFRITFTGKTEATVNSKITTIDKAVESIIVQNLTQNITKTINGSDILYLNPTGVASGTTVLHELINSGSSKLLVYPNPSIDKSTLTFNLPESGVSSVAINDLSGKMISYYTNYLETGAYKFQLPGLKSGLYIVSVNGLNYRGVEKLVSLGANSTNYNLIQNLGKTSIELVESQKSPMQKAMQSKSAAPVGLKFSTGDKLMIKCVSGRDTTIIMDTPLRTKEVEVLFVDCIDADNNSYPVVKIGALYWMTKNLKTTSYNNMMPLNLISNQVQWAQNVPTAEAVCYYNDNVLYKPIYGTLYTYGAAIADIKPANFRLPSRAEFYEMVNYLGDSLTAGAQLKSTDAGKWNANTSSKNTTGFNAIGSGYRSSTSFSTSGTVADFWTANALAKSDNAYSVELLYNSATLFATKLTPKKNALSIRCVYQPIDKRTDMLQGLFGTAANSKAPKVAGTPLSSKTVLMPADKELFFTSYSTSATDYVPKLQLLDSPNNNKVISLPLANITSTQVKWWNNLKKVATQTNDNGCENIVMAVWNEAKQGYSYGTGKVTLHIFGDSTATNSATGAPTPFQQTTIVLPEDYTLPNVWTEGTGDNGIPYNNWARLTNAPIIEASEWEMELRCADVNGDGFQDILVAVHDILRIYDGKTHLKIQEKNFSADQLVTTDQALSLRVEVADVNNDKVNDILVLTSSNMSGKTPKLHVFLRGNIQETDLNYHLTTNLDTKIAGYPIATATFAVGDILGTGSNQIVIHASNNNNGWANQYVTYMTLNADKSFSALQTPVQVDRNTMWMGGVILAKLKGPGKSYIVTSNRILGTDASGNLVFPFAGLNTTSTNVSFIGGDEYHVLGDQMVAGNFDKDPSGREMVYYIHTAYNSGFTFSNTIYLNCMSILNNKVIQIETQDYFKKDYNNDVSLPSKDMKLVHFPVIAAVNTKHKGRILEFDHEEYMLTQPRVLAVLAAAPYFSDNADNSNASTSWGKGASSSNSSEKGVTTSASVIFGFEQEFDVPLFAIKLGGIELTQKLTASFSTAFSTETTVSKSYSFNSSTENSVVVSAIPYDCYFYTIKQSGNADEIGKKLMISFPQDVLTQQLTVDSYNKAVDGQPAPQIDKTILTHTVGDPFSYKTDASPLSNVTTDEKFELKGSAYLGAGNTGYTTQNIMLNTANTTSKGFDIGYEAELVATVADVKLGAGYGFNGSNTVRTTIANSTNVGGNVPSVKRSAGSTSSFQWELVWYNYTKSNQTFSVVNYLVK